MRFADLQFGPHPVQEGGIQAKALIGKYEVSVVSLQNYDVYEVAIFDGPDGYFIQLPGIHPDYSAWSDDVIHHQSKDNVEGILLKLALIAGFDFNPYNNSPIGVDNAVI